MRSTAWTQCWRLRALNGAHFRTSVGRAQVDVSCVPPASMQKRKMAKLGTHSGSFHCDEALGCFLLQQLPEYKDAEIIRSRDPEVWKDTDVLIDVGGEYDPARHRYDHHQRGFDEVFGHGFKTKLSSAGLVYKHFGLRVIASLTGKAEDSDEVSMVWLEVYKQFMEAVDAIDNGVNMYDTDAPPRYLQRTTLSQRVGHLNPPWNVPHGNAELDALFKQAVTLTGSEFVSCVRHVMDVWLPARTIVKEALQAASRTHQSGEIIRLSQACPWSSHLYVLEEEAGVAGKVKFVLFEDTREGKWRVQAVNTEGTFALRKGLPVPWRGVRGEALSSLSGIPGCVFVHAAGFVGGNDTYEGALRMADAGLVQD